MSQPKPNSGFVRFNNFPKVNVGNLSPRSRSAIHQNTGVLEQKRERRTTVWKEIVNIITCCFPPFILSSVFRKRNPYIRHAFREKLALCIIILFFSAAVGYITFGFRLFACNPTFRISYNSFIAGQSSGSVSLHGFLYDLRNFNHQGNAASYNVKLAAGKDLSFLFPKDLLYHACHKYFPSGYIQLPCTVLNIPQVNFSSTTKFCHDSSLARSNHFPLFTNQQLFMSWDDIANPYLDQKLV
ncbi:Chitin synthase, class 3, partial [Nowakowskiella sp. JEL0078]